MSLSPYEISGEDYGGNATLRSNELITQRELKGKGMSITLAIAVIVQSNHGELGGSHADTPFTLFHHRLVSRTYRGCKTEMANHGSVL